MTEVDMDDDTDRAKDEPTPADTGADAPPDAAPVLKRTLPAWAWAAIGLLAGALIVGGIAFAYVSGLPAGERIGAGSGEATQTVEAGASADSSFAMLPTENTPPEEPVEEPVEPTADEPPPAVDPPQTPAPSPTPTSTWTFSQYPKLDIQPVTPVPVWRAIFNHTNFGPWEMPFPKGAPISKGHLRMTVLATDNANNSGFVQLQRVPITGPQLPNYGILYSWPMGSGNVIYKVTAPMAIEEGDYKLRLSIHGKWTVILEKLDD
jgi:hypothetical protein